MPMLMPRIIFDEKTQRDGIVLADGVKDREPLLGNVIHQGRKNLVFHFPPMQQSRPGLAGVAVRGNPCVLPILWPGKVSLASGAYKALALVGR